MEINKTLMQIFTRFLKENNCYQEFIDNFKNSEIIFRTTCNDTNYNEFSINKIFGFKYNPIDCFRWSDTKQGSTYWCNLNDKWRKLYYNENLEDKYRTRTRYAES